MGRYCSYQLPKQDGGTSQIVVNPTKVFYHQCHPVLYCRNFFIFRGSVYDAVVMLGCGGFGKHPATVLDELLRITRPGMVKLNLYKVQVDLSG